MTEKFTLQTLLRPIASVGARWISCSAEDGLAVQNPSTNATIGYVPRIAAEQVSRAIADAVAAQTEWAAQGARARAAILKRWFELVIEHKNELATILTMEQGKPLREAIGEIEYGASYIEWFAEEARRVRGTVPPVQEHGKRALFLKQPIGVVAAITPWNFPCAMVTRKVAPALASGCAIILKPASQTPFSAIALAILAEHAGLPRGLLSVLTGSATEIGAVLTGSEDVRKLSFTGSNEVGVKLYQQSAPTIKKLSLELGGNAPVIIFDDCDLDLAVEGALIAKFRNSGQTCVCANRIFVQAGVHDVFLERFTKRVSSLSIGDGMAAATDIGPLIDTKAVEKVMFHIEDAKRHGAVVRCGGGAPAPGQNFVAPTVLSGVDKRMLIFNEETFGPVAPIIRFETVDEVVRLANDTPFGLASYIFTKDLNRVLRVSEQLEFGMVGVNTGQISAAEAPFGGIKQSGIGREGGQEGIEEYLETKYICLAGLGDVA